MFNSHLKPAKNLHRFIKRLRQKCKQPTFSPLFIWRICFPHWTIWLHMINSWFMLIRPLVFVYFIASSLASATATAIFPMVHIEMELKHHRQTQAVSVWHKKGSKNKMREWGREDTSHLQPSGINMENAPVSLCFGTTAREKTSGLCSFRLFDTFRVSKLDWRQVMCLLFWHEKKPNGSMVAYRLEVSPKVGFQKLM